MLFTPACHSTSARPHAASSLLPLIGLRPRIAASGVSSPRAVGFGTLLAMLGLLHMGRR